MASAMNSSSHARTRSLRSNTLELKRPLTTPSASIPGPSSIKLFITNVRLLDLDLREDWPDITPATFSTKDQKKRIQSVEWALYHLFCLWDAEEARDKLQPFFPPLEPLQSLNLRAALLRCLEQAKKAGVLGREVLLRKTMLDECKGERLEEILAVFSNAVLKKVLQENGTGNQALAQQLALENFSYSGERSILSALIVAHKASLSKHLREKEASRAKYNDFSDLLNLNERRITRRHEQLKQVIEEHSAQENVSPREVQALQDQVQRNWSGADEWLQAIIYGDSTVMTDGVLGTPFDRVWKHVERGSIGDLEGKKHVGLLEQLDARVKDQEARLARWQNFGKTLTKNNSPMKVEKLVTTDKKAIDLGFNRHQALQLPRNESELVIDEHPAASLGAYTRIIENMRTELADIDKPQPVKSLPTKPSVVVEAVSSPVAISPPLISPVAPSSIPDFHNTPDPEDEWSSASEAEGVTPIVIREPTRSPATAKPIVRREPSSSPPLDAPRSSYQPRVSHIASVKESTDFSNKPDIVNRPETRDRDGGEKNRHKPISPRGTSVTESVDFSSTLGGSHEVETREEFESGGSRAAAPRLQTPPSLQPPPPVALLSEDREEAFRLKERIFWENL